MKKSFKKIAAKVTRNLENVFSPTMSINASAMYKNTNEMFYNSYQRQEEALANRINGLGDGKLILSKLGEEISMSELLYWYFAEIQKMRIPKTLKAQILYSEPVLDRKFQFGDILEEKTKKHLPDYQEYNGKVWSRTQIPVIYIGIDDKENDLGITISEKTKKVILVEVNLEQFTARRYL